MSCTENVFFSSFWMNSKINTILLKFFNRYTTFKSLFLECISALICSARNFHLVFDPLEVVGGVAGIIETKITQYDMNIRIS